MFDKVGRPVSKGLTLPDQQTEHLGQELKAPPPSPRAQLRNLAPRKRLKTSQCCAVVDSSKLRFKRSSSFNPSYVLPFSVASPFRKFPFPGDQKQPPTLSPLLPWLSWYLITVPLSTAFFPCSAYVIRRHADRAKGFEGAKRGGCFVEYTHSCAFCPAGNRNILAPSAVNRAGRESQKT